MKSAVLAALFGSSAAFSPASNGRTATALAGEKSAAIPFLPDPVNCQGYVGNVGFDPLRISDYFPTDYLREAELKHGRICMLAWLGYVAVDLGLVMPGMPAVSSAAAHDTAVGGPEFGIAFVGIFIMETTAWLGISQMLQGSGREPGNYGLGVQYLDYLCKNEKEVEQMKLKEITHCRLAMLAFAGVVTQSVLYDKGFPYF